MDEIYSTLSAVFQKLFEDDSIQVTAVTTANDVDGWDSLSHSLLILSIEKRFKIIFTQKEIFGFKNVGDMAKCIFRKIS